MSNILEPDNARRVPEIKPEAQAHAVAAVARDVGESVEFSHTLTMPEEWPNRLQAPQNLDVLIIENDPAAARLTKEAFREAGLTRGVRSVPDGDEALALLRREGKHASDPHPDLIFLDLHLPKKTGLEVLAEIKSHPRLKVTPVVVVSGSDNPDEVREAYELHASCFIRKPDDLHHFLLFIQLCFEFWGTVATLPPKPQAAAGTA